MIRHPVLSWSLIFSIGLTAYGAESRRGYFISLDGLQPDILDRLSAAGYLNAPYGLGAVYRNSLRSRHAIPEAVSLTAPSHISTITCSAPAVHGIIANAFRIGGRQVSGFEYPIHAETFWQAARRQGKTVASIAYVGADGKSPERSVDYGLTYPNSALLAGGDHLTLAVPSMPNDDSWVWPAEWVPKIRNVKAFTATIKVNPQTGESVNLPGAVVINQDGSQSIYLDRDKNGTSGFDVELKDDNTVADFYFLETDPASALKGAKRRVSFILGNSQSKTIDLWISKATYNNAHPQTYRQQLDDQNLVWPDDTFKKIAESDPLRFVAIGSAHDRFLAATAAGTATTHHSDVTLLYQPLIDSVEHAYFALLPQPFDPKNSDPVTQAFVAVYQAIDQNLNTLLTTAAPNSVVTVLGDHGMDATEQAIIINAVARDLADKIQIVTGGGMALVYPRDDDVAADAAGKTLAKRLSEIQYSGHSVLQTAHRRKGSTTWNFGDAVWVFQCSEKLWFRNGTPDGPFLDSPGVSGMHGHNPELPSMATAWMLKSHDTTPGELPQMRLIDAIPTFASLLGIENPLQCQGKSLVHQ